MMRTLNGLLRQRPGRGVPVWLAVMLPLIGRAADDLRMPQDSLGRKLTPVMLNEVVVKGEAPVATGRDEIGGEQLKWSRAATLGETLSRVPGVQNSYFGPNAGAAVIRGLSGNRVKVLHQGLSLNDLSGISPDFNVSLNPDNLRSVTLYKGSATVLYGGKAIGGAVDLDDNRVPLTAPVKPLAVSACLDGSTNNGYRQSFAAEGRVAQHWTWTLGGMNSWVSRRHIPGNSKPERVYDPAIVGFDTNLQLMAQVAVDAEHVLNTSLFPYMDRFVLDHLNDPEWGLSPEDVWTFKARYYDAASYSYKDNPPNPGYVPGQDPERDRYRDVVRDIRDYGPMRRGVIPNSHARANSLNLGTAYVDDRLAVGIGYQCDYAYYGVPAYAKIPEAGHTHTHADGTVHLFAVQQPFLPINVRSTSNLLLLQGRWTGEMPLFRKAKLLLGGQFASDKELLGEATVNRLGTSRGMARLELSQKEWLFLNGTVGMDYDSRRIDGRGRGRYLPDTRSRELAFFVDERADFSWLQLMMGYRHDFIRRRAVEGNGYQTGRGLAGRERAPRRFGLDQFSAGMKLDVLRPAYLRLSFTHSQRAPEVNELYAGNNHYAIVTEENGDDRLGKEIANAVEVEGGLATKHLEVTVNWYRTHYDGYLYLAHTGVSRGGLTVKEWRAADALLSGWEVRLVGKVDLKSLGSWQLGGYYDRVKSRNLSDSEMSRWAEGDFLPNMPTSRLGASLSGHIGHFTTQVALDHYLRQKYLGKHISDEFAFPAYSLLSARLSYERQVGRAGVECYVYGTNLLDSEARPQNSLLRYLAPLPGISLGGGICVRL